MNLEEYRTLFAAGSLILILVAAAPTLSLIVASPEESERFSELWLLGPNHMAQNYPINITRNHNYSVFLGIRNRIGHSAYYLVEVKFRNQTQSAPNSFDRTPSNLTALFNITAFVANENIWELPLTFSFDYWYNKVLFQVEFYNLTLNDVVLDIANYIVSWDSKNNGFFVNLFFETWIYNATSSSIQYHNRFVGIWLNLTTPA